MNNPFIIKAYKSRELFCDRQNELQLMLRNSINHTDMTLISQRRMGKTGLVLRLFDEIAVEHPDIHTIYLDIFSSRNIDDFIKLLAEATMKSFKPKTSISEKLMSFIKTMRPQLSFDNITGEPQLTIAYQSPHEKEYTLRGLLEFLDSQDVHIIIAIDEVQQIRDYPEKNMEALLRTYIQQTRNLTFIYCGSKKHLMADIFTNENKPFYSSTAFVSLGRSALTPTRHSYDGYSTNMTATLMTSPSTLSSSGHAATLIIHNNCVIRFLPTETGTSALPRSRPPVSNSCNKAKPSTCNTGKC